MLGWMVEVFRAPALSLSPECVITMALGCDIIEPPPLSQEWSGHESVAVGEGVGVAGWSGGHRNRWEVVLRAGGRRKAWGEGSMPP